MLSKSLSAKLARVRLFSRMHSFVSLKVRLNRKSFAAPATNVGQIAFMNPKVFQKLRFLGESLPARVTEKSLGWRLAFRFFLSFVADFDVLF